MPFIYRAGAWKPRTSPDSFQGAGVEALSWLEEVQQTLGLEVATEVATPDHVREALFAGIDYIWIGARTSANPIAVQTLADTIRTTKRKPKAVLVKNPVHNDVALWLGNIERLEQTGTPVMAIHRGCNHKPCWAMAHALRLARPEIPLLIDPSHMSGDSEQIAPIWAKATELAYNGVMVEVHCCPEQALSDSAQQITPTALTALLKEQRPLTLKDRYAESMELNWLRAEIDELDDQLWEAIDRRMDVSRRIGEWKKAHGIAPLQPERYQEIVERLKVKGERIGLDTDFLLRLWELIHQQSLKQQK